jgi:hypothetical protein
MLLVDTNYLFDSFIIFVIFLSTTQHITHNNSGFNISCNLDRSSICDVHNTLYAFTLTQREAITVINVEMKENLTHKAFH